jgi:RNA polymerase sigma factor (sigma-70 family)
VERTAVPIRPRGAVRRPKRLLALRSDERLVEHVRGGDDAAFEVLYERHVAAVLGFCRHMLGSQAEAEDAVQQAFVSAHRDMLRGARDINFKPWLYTIARNRCLSMLRARREQASELPEISTAGLSDGVEQRDELRDLVRDVQRLPHDLREALVLSELGDLSHAEIADVLDVEPKAVKALVFRARSALIERRDARGADCGEIREELSLATGGGLRRSRLRYHLEGCPGCQAYLGEVRRQRQLLGLALPVVPTLALKDSVMAATGIGAAGAAVGGGVAATGGAVSGGALGVGAAATTAPLVGGSLAKVAVMGALALGGTGVATGVVTRDGIHLDRSGGKVQEAPGDGSDTRSSSPSEEGATNGVRRSEERSHGRRGDERSAAGQRRADERSDGKSKAGEHVSGVVPEKHGGPKTDRSKDPKSGGPPTKSPFAAPAPPGQVKPRADHPTHPPHPTHPEDPVMPPKSHGGSGSSPSPPDVTPPDPTPPPQPRHGKAPVK